MLSNQVVFNGCVYGKYSAYVKEEAFDLMEIIRRLISNKYGAGKVALENHGSGLSIPA
ncbi:MAG: hypothetical protein ACLFM1_07050 [Bacteroidales bacterium]